MPLALRVSDYVYVLHKGRIVHQCGRSELVENEALLTEYIGVSKYEKDRVFPVSLHDSASL